MERAGEVPLLPPNPAPYLVRWLLEIGPSGYGSMGPIPIGWRDIVAWQELVGPELMPWEARTLRRLSGDYVGEVERARKPDSAAPFSGKKEDVINRRDIVSKKLDGWFGAMKKKG